MPENPSEGRPADDHDATELSVGQLVSEVSGNISTLVRLELEVAKLELAHDAKQVGKGSGLFIGAAFMMHMVLILLSVTLGFVFYEVVGLSGWLSFLIVTLIYLLAAAVLVGVGVLFLRKRRGLPRFTATVSNSLAVMRREGSTAGTDVRRTDAHGSTATR